MFILVYIITNTTMKQITDIQQKCDHCDYEWQARVQKPKACPRCKRRFDYYEL